MIKWNDITDSKKEMMLRYQEEQGNKRDESVFERLPSASKEEGGFDWKDTLYGFECWQDFLSNVDSDKMREFIVDIKTSGGVRNIRPIRQYIVELKDGSYVRAVSGFYYLYNPCLYNLNNNTELLESEYSYVFEVPFNNRSVESNRRTDVSLLKLLRETIMRKNQGDIETAIDNMLTDSCVINKEEHRRLSVLTERGIGSDHLSEKTLRGLYKTDKIIEEILAV